MARKITHHVLAKIGNADWHVAARATSERSARSANTRLHNRVSRGELDRVQTKIVEIATAD